MSHKIKRLLISIIIGIIMFIGIMYVIHLLNMSTSHYIVAKNNKIDVNMELGKRLYMIDNIVVKEDEVKLEINHELDDSIAIIIDYLKFPYEIYIDDKLSSQNVDKKGKKYLDNFAYQYIKIKDSTTIKVKGKGVKYTTFFIVMKDQLSTYLEKRQINYGFILFAFLILGVINIIFFVMDRTHVYFILLAFISFMTAFKVVILGEILFMTEFFGITTSNYQQLNIVTSMLNMIIPAFIMGFLFKIKVSWKIKVCIYAFFVATCLAVLDLETYATYFRLILMAMTLFSIYTLCYGVWYEKDYCYLVLLNNAKYFALTMYKNYMDIHLIRKGTLDFLVHISYLGALIYLGGFLIIFIYDYFKQIKALKEKESEFDRISLLRGISHDLKLPLSVIKSSIQIIENYDLSKNKRMKYLKAGLEASEELEKMTENISSYLKVGVAKYQEQTSSVRYCFDKLRVYFDIYNKDKIYDFLLDCDQEDANIPMDSIQFYRMIFNLVDNAFKYTPEGGAIHVSYRVQRKVIITVEDNGIGIPMDKQKHIFDPFYRVDESRSKEGLGLGLCVVKDIVESAKGNIVVESESGHGTQITISLPMNHHREQEYRA